MKTIGEIKEEFSAAREADWNAICQMYETDLRSGVQKLVQQYRKKLDALEKEKLRMEQMMQFEHKYEHLGYLCGIERGTVWCDHARSSCSRTGNGKSGKN